MKRVMVGSELYLKLMHYAHNELGIPLVYYIRDSFKGRMLLDPMITNGYCAVIDFSDDECYTWFILQWYFK